MPLGLNLAPDSKVFWSPSLKPRRGSERSDPGGAPSAVRRITPASAPSARRSTRCGWRAPAYRTGHG
eukprot:14556214-Alexandrium_andersonii.AAC.1